VRALRGKGNHNYRPCSLYWGSAKILEGSHKRKIFGPCAAGCCGVRCSLSSPGVLFRSRGYLETTRVGALAHGYRKSMGIIFIEEHREKLQILGMQQVYFPYKLWHAHKRAVSRLIYNQGSAGLFGWWEPGASTCLATEGARSAASRVGIKKREEEIYYYPQKNKDLIAVRSQGGGVVVNWKRQ